MFIELIISLFGTAVVHRNLSLVEKSEVLSVFKLRVIFCFLQLPFYYFLFFKEQIHYVLIYIGIFLTTLILHDKIIAYFDQKTFEKLHFNIIERLILLLCAGKSSSTCVQLLWNELNSREKRIFIQLHHMFEVKNNKNIVENSFNGLFFAELKTILSSSAGITEQLRSLRDILRVQNNLRQKSQQILHQTRAQALIAAAIYMFFGTISLKFLNLDIKNPAVAASAALFVSGQLIIFKLGGKMRWTT